MRPTFLGFETATNGLMASQKALDIVGNNIANIGVTGYTRQRVDLVSMSVNITGKYGASKTSLAGAGATVSGISQIRDSYLDKRFRDEYADVGYFDTVTSILKDVETNLNEIEPSNITSALTALENAWAEMQTEGGQSQVTTSSVLSASRTLTQVFTQMSTKLSNLWQQHKTDLGNSVDTVNTLLQQIADYNKTIKNDISIAYGGSSTPYGPNELLDQRNVLIDELSQYADISVQNLSDGTVTITMGTDGHVAVEDTNYDSLLVAADNNSSSTVKLLWKSTGEETGISSGILQGASEMLNGRGIDASPSAGESLENGILYYMDKLDAFASTLADTFNNFIPTVDSSGNLTGDYKQLFSFSGDGEKTAANLTVNSNWIKDSSYIITDIHPTGEGVDDTTFVTNALSLFSTEHDFGEFEGTFNDYIQFYTTSQLATEITYNENCLESCTDVTDSLLTSISEVSGVSMEEEGVDMTQWTKAFNAMSRVMTAMDEVLDTLINKTGLVGRS